MPRIPMTDYTLVADSMVKQQFHWTNGKSSIFLTEYPKDKPDVDGQWGVWTRHEDLTFAAIKPTLEEAQLVAETALDVLRATQPTLTDTINKAVEAFKNPA